MAVWYFFLPVLISIGKEVILFGEYTERPFYLFAEAASRRGALVAIRLL